MHQSAKENHMMNSFGHIAQTTAPPIVTVTTPTWVMLKYRVKSRCDVVHKCSNKATSKTVQSLPSIAGLNRPGGVTGGSRRCYACQSCPHNIVLSSGADIRVHQPHPDGQQNCLQTTLHIQAAVNHNFIEKSKRCKNSKKGLFRSLARVALWRPNCHVSSI